MVSYFHLPMSCSSEVVSSKLRQARLEQRFENLNSSAKPSLHLKCFVWGQLANTVNALTSYFHRLHCSSYRAADLTTPIHAEFLADEPTPSY